MGGDVLNKWHQSRNAIRFNKTLDDLRGEGAFSVGGVKNQRFLIPAKKTVDACRAVVQTPRHSSTVLLVGNKNFEFLTPPTLDKPSPRKSCSVFVESNGIARLLSFFQYISSR